LMPSLAVRATPVARKSGRRAAKGGSWRRRVGMRGAGGKGFPPRWSAKGCRWAALG